MAAPIPPGNLKCVVALSPVRDLRPVVEEALRGHVAPDDVRPLDDGVLLLYCLAGTATLRDWIAPALQENESLLVVEFDRWSGWGAEVDRDWLRRRGH